MEKQSLILEYMKVVGEFVVFPLHRNDAGEMGQAVCFFIFVCDPLNCRICSLVLPSAPQPA